MNTLGSPTALHRVQDFGSWYESRCDDFVKNGDRYAKSGNHFISSHRWHRWRCRLKIQFRVRVPHRGCRPNRTNLKHTQSRVRAIASEEHMHTERFVFPSDTATTTLLSIVSRCRCAARRMHERASHGRCHLSWSLPPSTTLRTKNWKSHGKCS